MSYYSRINGGKNFIVANNDKVESVEFLYQPVVCKDTKETLYYEQLARFQSGQGRIRHTQTIIEWFEVTGEIVDLDIYSFDVAISNLSAFDDINIGVNISGATLSNKDACEIIVNRLKSATKVCPRLYVEVTETHSISNMLYAAEFAGALDGMGAQMVVDDFGEGNSTALYLSVLTPALVKLRMSSGSQVSTDHIEKATLARTYGAGLVIEGVESAEDMRAFTKGLADFYQGYFVGEPARLQHWRNPVPRPELKLVSNANGF